MSDTKWFKHPSYGLVQFSRVNHGGKTKLFGSSIDNHMTSIVLRIARGKVTHDLGHDHYMDEEGIIEVELSNSQFTELLTTMNMGRGVPCTIRRQGGEMIEDPPPVNKECDRIKEDFKGKLMENIKAFSRYTTQLLARLDDKTPLKATERNELKDRIYKIKMELECNAPFYLSEFEESADKMTVAAKCEVDAMITHVMNSLGVKAFANQSQEAKVKLLTGDTNVSSRTTDEPRGSTGAKGKDRKETTEETTEVPPAVSGTRR